MFLALSNTLLQQVPHVYRAHGFQVPLSPDGSSPKQGACVTPLTQATSFIPSPSVCARIPVGRGAARPMPWVC